MQPTLSEIQAIFWFDRSAARSLAEKIRNGAENYHRRTGHYPNVVTLNVADAGTTYPEVIAGCRLSVQPFALRNHFHFNFDAEAA